MPVVPITRCVQARWERPRYELLDARGRLLDALDKVAPIAGFRPDHDALDVEFVDGLQLSVSMQELTVISMLTTDPAVYRPQVLAVAETLGSPLVWADFSMQFLIAWPGQDDSGRVQAEAAIAASGIETAADCAAVIDGVSDGWMYNAEYGVVDLQEIPDRIARRVGRAAGPKIDSAISGAKFSQVSTFVDCRWKAAEQWDVSLDKTWVIARAADELASQLASDLHNHLMQRVEGRNS
jgi:hypothetical protein